MPSIDIDKYTVDQTNARCTSWPLNFKTRIVEIDSLTNAHCVVDFP